MSKNVIFCYSGSGNCLDIAKNIARELGDTDIVMMRSKPENLSYQNAKTVGFVFPCYGGGLPGDYEKYVRMIKIPYTAYTYGVVSYSGYPGIGLKIIDEIFPLDYWEGISHNCACIWLFPHKLMMPMMSTEKAQKRSEELAKGVAEAVKARKFREDMIPNNKLNAIEAKFWPKVSAKKAKKFSVNAKCIGCGQCERICPKKNIKLGIDGRPVFGTNCIQCLSCLQFCPTKAINMGKVTEKRERYHNANVSADELMKEVIHID